MPRSKKKKPVSKAKIILILSISLIMLGVIIYAINYFVLQNPTGFLSAPSSLSTSTSSCTGTKFSWSSVGSGVKYAVLYLTYGASEKASSSTSYTYKTISGFAPGVLYNWRVLACPYTGAPLSTCSVSSYKSFTQRCRPSSLQATSVTCQSERLTWTAPTGSGVSGYLLALSPNSDMSNSGLYYPNPVTATTFTFTGLKGNTRYYTRVAGYATINGRNFYDTSGTISFLTTPCATPTCNILCTSCLTLQNEDCSFTYNYEGCRSSCSCSATCIGCNWYRQSDCREVENGACWNYCQTPYYWPTDDTLISSYFNSGHPRGIDIDGHITDDVYSMTTGQVLEINNACTSGTEYGSSPSWGCGGCDIYINGNIFDPGGTGRCVIILNDDGKYSLYTHLSSVSVNKGDRVLKGKGIGEIGNSGSSAGGHLHLELLSSSGSFLNPCDYLDGC